MATLPVYSTKEIADYLVAGYWVENGGAARSFAGSGQTARTSGTSLTVDLSGLTEAGKTAARGALGLWSDVAAVSFREVSGGAQITFDDNESGAFSYSYYRGSTITSSSVNVSTAWLASYGSTPGTYGFQTYIHEIGHALGLGHAGNYNGSASFDEDAHYQNDSWQMTIMSYYSQGENPYVDASSAYLLTPMRADVMAIQSIYGSASGTRAGNTTYGFNTNAGSIFDFAQTGAQTALTIYDSAGGDTIDASRFGQNQRIDLSPGSFSDIGGLIGNIAIAEAVTIENAVGGSGNDLISGNHLGNTLYGGAGDDMLAGGLGSDYLDGGSGNDTAIVSELFAADNFLFTDGALIYFGDSTDGSRDRITGIEFLTDGIKTIAATAVSLFDGLAYIASYGDLAYAFGANAAAGLHHFSTYGFAEGRSITFDAKQYLSNYGDLQAAFGSDTALATAHYVNFGRFEGRLIQSPLEYVASFGDLISVFHNLDMNSLAAAALSHFNTFGSAEGRAATTDFDTDQYIENYGDLAAAFVDSSGHYDEDVVLFHYIHWGYFEGRTDADLGVA